MRTPRQRARSGSCLPTHSHAPTLSPPRRYFKYLSKKYLKKNQLREYLRVLAGKDKNAYEMKYFKLGEEEEADA